MKRTLLTLLASISCLQAQEKLAINNNSIDTIISAHLTLQKAGRKDAADFVSLINDLEVSRYMFVAPITQEKIDAIKQSKFKTNILAPLFFALPEFAQRKLAGAGPRWMIKDKENNIIGSLSLSTLPDGVKEFLKTKGINSNNYENLGLTLKPSVWHKGYAKETIFVALSKLFNNKKYTHLKGVALCVNKDHTMALERLINKKTKDAKKPITYQGELFLPNGFHKIAPEACYAECFTISKDDFMPLLGTSNNNN